MKSAMEMKSVCITCGKPIVFNDSRSDFKSHDYWIHEGSRSQFCSMLPFRAAPARPQPDPDGGTAEDDLIGVLGMLSEIIAAVDERFVRSSTLHEVQWRNIWREWGER